MPRWRVRRLDGEDAAFVALPGLLIFQLWRILASPAAGDGDWTTGTVIGLGFAVPVTVAWNLRLRSPGKSTWHPWQVFTAVLLMAAVFTTFSLEPLPEGVHAEVVAGSWYFAAALANCGLVMVMPPRRVSERLGPDSAARPLTRTAKFKNRRPRGRR